MLEAAPNPRNPIADHPPVGLDLRFAGNAEEAETAALAFEVGPAAHEPTRLILEMRELDLQAALRGRCSFAEESEEKAGTVDYFCATCGFELALLNRAEGSVDSDTQAKSEEGRGGKKRRK